MHITAVSLAFVGVFTAGLALAQGIEPQNSRQPGVIEKWSSELLETVDYKVEAAEHAVRIMEQLHQERSAPGEDSLAPDQWPELTLTYSRGKLQRRFRVKWVRPYGPTSRCR